VRAVEADETTPVVLCQLAHEGGETRHVGRGAPLSKEHREADGVDPNALVTQFFGPIQAIHGIDHLLN
jgi:hypothetical protein